jgi:hypothetical protein
MMSINHVQYHTERTFVMHAKHRSTADEKREKAKYKAEIKRLKEEGRKLVESEQISVRLPKWMLAKFREPKRMGVSKEINERLGRSITDEDAPKDTKLDQLKASITELAKRVRHHFGADWHADANAFAVFMETVTRLLKDKAPTATAGEPKHAPALVAEIIYANYIGELREHDEGKRTTEMRPTIESQLTQVEKRK